MAIYDLGTASLSANGEVTGVGTTWKAPLTLIRVGATIVFKTEPVKIYTISEIISDTQINVYNPNSETVPSGTGYAILAHDGITVQGLAQDVAETLRYYQSRETEVADAVDTFNNFDIADFDSKVTQVNTQHGDVVSIGAEVSANAAQVTTDKNSAASSAASASLDKDAAAASAQEAADYAASLDTENLLRKDLALSDLTDKALSRNNLDVYSRQDVDNLIKGFIVRPEDFGAVGDGVTDDSDAFIAAEDYAFANKGMISASGEYGFSKGFVSRVPFDFSRATFHVLSSWNGATSRFLVHLTNPDNKTESLNIVVVTGGTAIPALSAYTNHCVSITSTTEVGYVRTGNNINKQDVFHIINGVCQGFPANIDFNSVCTVRSTPLDVNPIVVKLPKVIFDAVPSIPVNHVFRIDRAFVTVVGGSYNTNAQSVEANRQAFNAFVNLTNVCYGVRVTGVSGFGFFKNASDGFSYTVNLSGIYPTVDNCFDPENWGLVDGTLLKGGLIHRCHGARMGTHEDATDLTISECTAYTRGFMLGSGYGKLVFRDCVFYMREAQNMIEFRYDYGNCWKGDILIDNPSVHMSPGLPAYTALIKFQVALNSGIYLSPNVTAYTCNTLTIRNVNLYSDTQQTNAYEMWNVASDFSQNVSMPTKVVIENVNIMAPVTSYIRVGVSGAYFSANARMVSKRTEVYVENMVVPDPANNYLITPRIADAEKVNMRNRFSWNFTNVTNIAINASLPGTSEVNILGGSVFRLDNSSISGMTDQTKFKIKDCYFTDTIQCRTNGGQIELDNCRFTVAGAVALGGIIKSYGTTIAAGSTITGQISLSAALLSAYRDTSIFA